jgi:hypothetical protein
LRLHGHYHLIAAEDVERVLQVNLSYNAAQVCCVAGVESVSDQLAAATDARSDLEGRQDATSVWAGS